MGYTKAHTRLCLSNRAYVASARLTSRLTAQPCGAIPVRAKAAEALRPGRTASRGPLRLDERQQSLCTSSCYRRLLCMTSPSHDQLLRHSDAMQQACSIASPCGRK